MKAESERFDRLMRFPPLLRGGFRPFFLGGAAWALVAIGLWMLSLAGAFELPSAFAPLAWRRHEMLFGYLGAVIAGFLLTAVPNWTGRLPIAGSRLAALAGLRLTGRLAMLLSAHLGAPTAFFPRCRLPRRADSHDRARGLRGEEPQPADRRRCLAVHAGKRAGSCERHGPRRSGRARLASGLLLRSPATGCRSRA